MLKFINNGTIIMIENDDGQIELVGKEQKEEFEKAKKALMAQEVSDEDVHLS